MRIRIGTVMRGFLGQKWLVVDIRKYIPTEYTVTLLPYYLDGKLETAKPIIRRGPGYDEVDFDKDVINLPVRPPKDYQPHYKVWRY